MGRTHDDDDAPESVRRALRRLIEDGVTPGDPDAPEVAAEFFGRADALELLEEVIVEARLARTLIAHDRSAPGRNPERRTAVQPRELAVLSLRSREPVRGSGKTWRSWAIAAVALLALGLTSSVIAIRLVRSDAGAHGVPQYLAASTGAAELDTLELPDGSRAIIAPNTSLRYSIAPNRGPRMVTLEGEAYFEVHHDDARPFRVKTRRAVITDLGTAFVVREYASDLHALVAVRSGAASLLATADGAMRAMTMRPGDGAYVDSHGEISRFSGDPESYGAWTSGTLAFDGAALPEVLDRLGSWYDVGFRLADSTLSTQYFTGEFRSVPLGEALAILGPIVHARFAQEGRVVVVTAISAGR